MANAEFVLKRLVLANSTEVPVPEPYPVTFISTGDSAVWDVNVLVANSIGTTVTISEAWATTPGITNLVITTTPVRTTLLLPPTPEIQNVEMAVGAILSSSETLVLNELVNPMTATFEGGAGEMVTEMA